MLSERFCIKKNKNQNPMNMGMRVKVFVKITFLSEENGINFLIPFPDIDKINIYTYIVLLT